MEKNTPPMLSDEEIKPFMGIVQGGILSENLGFKKNNVLGVFLTLKMHL